MPNALIVEDEPEANQLLALLVQLRGYQTNSAFTGREALALAEQHRPDLIFLDLMLPDANGIEVCRTLRADPATTAIPVVMVTARLAETARIEGFRAGASAYIPKPYTPDQIYQAMSQADSWRCEIGQLDALSIPLTGSGELSALRALGQLRSAILARQIPTPVQAGRLETFLRQLGGLLGRGSNAGWGGSGSQLDYREEPGGVTLTLGAGDPAVGSDPALDALVAAALFDEVRRELTAEATTWTLRMRGDRIDPRWATHP